MWTSVVSSFDFFNANRWTVSFFNRPVESRTSHFPMVPLGSIASERRGAEDPQALGDVEINYLGLENVRPLTGELVDFAPRPAVSIKSRSKVFKEGDVLYGRLRPELNKVFLASGVLSQGLCSGEFIVLVPNCKQVMPRYLRHVLASTFVTTLVKNLRVGASLPRLSTDDLLALEIPLPPLSIQKQLVAELEALDTEIVRLRSAIETLPSKGSEALVATLMEGSTELNLPLGH